MEVPVYEASNSNTSVDTDIENLPQTDVLSLYIGLVQKRVYSNWKVTLGEKSKKKVAVSFRLFPNGKIEAPTVKESSGIRKLDDLAVQAIVNSEPFPRFPSEIKEPNLFLKIRFKYIPELINQ